MHFLSAHAVITTLIDSRAAGDIETFLGCYETEPAIVAQSGQVETGLAAAQQAMESFTGLKPVLTVGERQIIEAETTALHMMRWRLQGTAPDGTALDLTGRTADVLRRQPDGGWLVAIDNPYGTDVLPAGPPAD
jgi:ketosteroid isomerase-like protein